VSKWQGNESDHSSPSRTEVKNAWNFNFTSLYICMVRFSDRGITLLSSIGLAGKLGVQEAQGRWCHDE
jgi:hypothetical protein